MRFSVFKKIIFFFLLAIFTPSCGTTQNSYAAFFEGLLAEALAIATADALAGDAAEPDAEVTVAAADIAALSENSADNSRLLFVQALENSPPIVQREAARKLMLPVLNNDEAFAQEVLRLTNNRALRDDDHIQSLRNACLFRLGRYAEIIRSLEGLENIDITGINIADINPWNHALYILSLYRNEGSTDASAMEKIHKQALDFLLTLPVSPVWHWVLGEFTAAGASFFNPGEFSAFSLRAETARSAFGRATLHFGLSLVQSGAHLFLQYPQLLTDAGRSIQFTNAFINEGINILSNWEENLPEFERNPEFNINPQTRYLLPYFLGRIFRQAGQSSNSTQAFERAIRYAPLPIQSDACIWYILMNAIRENQQNAVNVLKTYIPRMHSFPYFRDIFDRFSQYLVSRKDWGAIEEIYSLLISSNSPGGLASVMGAAAQYAWILGRAIEQGYISSAVPPSNYFQAIYNEESAPLYYRILSAEKLGMDFTMADDAPEVPTRRGTLNISPEAQFLLEFFNHNAGSLAMPYILEYQDSLETHELRMIAAALADAGLTNQSLNLITSYSRRTLPDYSVGHSMFREDYELFFPRPFLDLMENYTNLTNVAPELFYAIVRTESFFMPAVASHAGAIGLSQLMPATALDMAERIARATGPDYRSPEYSANGGIDLRNPQTNIHIGSFYMNYLFQTMDSPMLAILAYNGGMGRVRRWRAAEPVLPEDLFLETIEFAETREYGRRILQAAALYGYLYYSMNTSEVVADIYR